MGARVSFSLFAAGALAASALLACSEGSPLEAPHALRAVDAPPPSPAPATLAGWAEEDRAALGDAAHGKALVARYECNRCHEGTGQPAPVFDRQCSGCHQLVVAGKLPAPAERRDAIEKATRHYVVVPSLKDLGATLRPSWIAGFLHEPQKVRSHLEEWMPRLAISESDARDIATYLTAGAPAEDERPLEGDAARGKEVVAKKGCFLCHDFTGAARGTSPMEMPSVEPGRLARAIAQAPDLRFARDRFRPDALARWIHDPSSVRPGALMPTLGLTDDEARDAAAYVLTTQLAPPPPAAPPIERLPVLDRRVTYDEVAREVFTKSCVHCHADPGPSGDPGPGSAGGFGFAPRGVRLLSYEGTRLGYLDESGARKSLLSPEPALARWGGSRLVASLVARHEEVSGRPLTEVRGMPMGLPPLTREQIQLVETWVAQGAPR